MENIDHWINIYSIFFSISILSVAFNLSLWVKDVVNRILLTITLTGVIRFALNWFIFPEASVGYTQQQEMASFIYLGFDKNLFSGALPFFLSIFALVALIYRILPRHKKALGE
ncbi:hypothetical protein MN869_19420 [Acinetobacter sp. NIPH1876]|nr:hypothetical protein [Acinetobacter sp. NIPH1876]MCJ0830578.1 hypothetical protein [Acinetobacter sp. NIPH1876]